MEEPDAAPIISAALNKPNDAALKIAHMEMLRTLVNLCEPGPRMEVKFEPVQAKLRNMFRREIDHMDWVKAFEAVMVGGGRRAPSSWSILSGQGTLLTNSTIHSKRIHTRFWRSTV